MSAPARAPEESQEVSKAGPSTTSVASKSVNSPPKETRTHKAPHSTETVVKSTNVVPDIYPPRVDQTPVGNKHLEMVLRRAGRVGHFWSRSQIARHPTPITIEVNRFYLAVTDVVTAAVKRQLNTTLQHPELDIQDKAAHFTPWLVYGICVMTFLKLRSLHSMDVNFMDKYSKKPKVPASFKILAPYALAISQLGMFTVSSFTREVILTPDIPEADATRYMLPADVRWSPATYSNAVEFAEKIGLQFHPVDTSQKIGSSWWMYAVDIREDLIKFRCPIPEDNFTVDTALLRTLFLVIPGSQDQNKIFRTDQFGDDDYGSMLRNPPDDIALSTFFAVEKTHETAWKLS